MLSPETNACRDLERSNSLGPLQEIIDHIACSSLKSEYDAFVKYRNQITIFPIKDETIFNELRAKNERLNSLAIDCQNKRFEMCYPDLSPSIKKQELDKLFKKWTQDGRFHYLSGGGGACGVRAKNLAHELAQLGYQAKAVRIHPAPTLIAMEKTRDGRYNGGYYDYHGSHSVVQILVKENGILTPYILDPQFMNAPLKRVNYFVQTMGQDCVKVENYASDSDVPSSLNCYFSEKPQNSSMGTINPYKVLNNQQMQCGWHFDVSETESFAKFANFHPAKKDDKKLVLLNDDGSGVPSKFNGLDISESTSSDLILHAYEQLQEKLQEELTNYEQRLSQINATTPSLDYPESEIEKDRDNYIKAIKQKKQDIANYPAKMEIVRKNLKH